MANLVPGLNDLATLHPKIAAEADGWDPSTVTPGSGQNRSWKCSKGHKWNTVINARTLQKQGCPYCANKRVLAGFNDLKTRFPEIAAEADGWDPSTVIAGTNKKLPWICKLGHRWNISPNSRIYYQSGCPYCSHKKILVGFNDLKTTFPEVAKEAHGWDPSTLIAGSHKKMLWQCEKGHTWKSQITNRTHQKQGCPYCSNTRVWNGFTEEGKQRFNNDFKTKFPELAEEADGWDPSTVTPGSNKKRSWKCSKGHTWITSITIRTGKTKSGCPYCANQEVWIGFNDLETLRPEIAAEANGWDPTTLLIGSHKKVGWKCAKGHEWKATVKSRTLQKQGCPYCANKRVLPGFNDLKTHFPELAAEADGWDPSTVVSGSGKKMQWKCNLNHKWIAEVKNRALNGVGCPECAERGFNPGKSAWFYLMQRFDSQQQLGITNYLTKRVDQHKRYGWILLDHSDEANGRDVFETEKKYKKWLKQKIGLVPGTKENWFISDMNVNSLAELKEKSEIDTSIF